MADTEPKISNRAVAWIGGATALVLAVGGLATAIGGLPGSFKRLCEGVHACAAPEKPALALADYTSPRVDGGHNADEMCAPAKAAYEQQYPGYTINMTPMPDHGDKDWKGHVTYVYTCKFSGTPKST